MFSKLAVVLTLALYCAATPVVVRDNHIKLPVARRFNFDKTAGFTVADIDRARARQFKSRGALKGPVADSTDAGSPHNDPVTNAVTTYTATVQVGNPPAPFTLLIDSGSSNTFVGTTASNRPKSGSLTATGKKLSITFGSGSVSGTEDTGTISFSGITITNQGIGSITKSSGFDGVDGILGIGPTDLTEDTVSGVASVPTVVDNAFSQGLIPTKEVGISFAPTTVDSITNGELTFGGIDTTKFTGSLVTVPLTKTSPANEFVGIDQTVSYGTTTILKSTAGIVDTGTTLLLLATDALTAYQKATGAVLDNNTGLLKVTAAQFANLKSLFFTIGGTQFELTPNAQIWPRSLNTAIGGNANSIYLVASDLGSPSGEGLDFINGFAFLERFYAVWNSGANTISFATTANTDATSN